MIAIPPGAGLGVSSSAVAVLGSKKTASSSALRILVYLFHPAIELSARQPCAHGIAWLHFAGHAHYRTRYRILENGIAASERGKRAQGIECLCRACHAFLGTLQHPAYGVAEMHVQMTCAEVVEVLLGGA